MIKKTKHFPSIQIYTKQYTKQKKKSHDKTTSNKLGEVDLHYYYNIQSSTRLLYTYTPYISNFIYLQLYYLYGLFYYN